MKNAAKLIILVFILSVFFIITSAFTGSAQLPPSVLPPPITVGLAWAKSVTVTCQGAFTLQSSQGSSSMPANQEVTLYESQGKAALGSWVYESPVVLYPDEPQSGAYLVIKGSECSTSDIKGTAYKGRIVIIPAQERLLVANIVDIETYTKSVVSSEMSDSWPKEALEAQAVAVRTYAAYRTGVANLPGFGLTALQDLSAFTPDLVGLWADDQVYKGALAEKPNGARAAESTKGEILTYSDRPIAAYFHSSAEGMTESTLNVWGGDVPYLMPVEEVFYESPYSAWTAEYDQSSLQEKLSCLGVMGPIETI